MADPGVADQEVATATAECPGIDPATAVQIVLTEVEYTKLKIALALELGQAQPDPAVNCRDLSPFGR